MAEIDNSNLIQLSDFVGEHGPYQMITTILLFIRYVFLGLMANSGPLMTPDVTYYCSLPMDEIIAIMPNITLLNQTEQDIEIREEFKRICQIDLHLYQQAFLNYSVKLNSSQQTKLMFNGHKKHVFNETDKIRECTDYTYDIEPELGRTMTSEFDLVCDRDWLRSVFQSIISAAIVVAHVFWGTFSDKYGRYTAQKYCLTISLISGTLSIFAMDFWSFTICRALCSFGDLGLAVSLTTTVVELVGNNYRGLSVAWVNFGSALGVTVFPFIVAYFQDFKLVITFTVICNLATVPFFMFQTNESIRWLLTNRKFHSAKKELKRLIRTNKRYYRLLSIILWPLKNKGYFKHHIVGYNRNSYDKSGQDENDNTTTMSNNEKQMPKNNDTKITWLEEKQAFEMLFKNFIDQIESQNFCDPLGPTSFQLESPSVTSGFAADLSTEQTDVLMMAAATGGNQSKRIDNNNPMFTDNNNILTESIDKNKRICDNNNNNNSSRIQEKSIADLQVEDIQSKLAETGRPSISSIEGTSNVNLSINQNTSKHKYTSILSTNKSELQAKLNKISIDNDNNGDELAQDLENVAEIKPAINLPEIYIEEYQKNHIRKFDYNKSQDEEARIDDDGEQKSSSASSSNQSCRESDNSGSSDKKSNSAPESKISNEQGEVEGDEEFNWNYLKAPYSRSDSCGHLDKNINEKRCHFLLTIPANDPDCMLNVSHDFRDARFVRRRGQQQPDCINMVANQLSFVGRVNRVFKDKQLMLVVFTIVWTTFNSELQYTSFIIINMEVGEDVKWNYFLGGCMEFSAAIIASLLLSIASRRHTLILFWLLISIFCFGLSVAHIDSTWAVLLLALAKFSQSCLSSIASVAAFESFPTFLRQSGSGLVSTLGMLGSVFAPLIFAEFDDHDGMDRVLMIFSLLSLTAAILIYLFLKETKNRELN